MNEFKPFEQPSKTKVAIVAGGRVEAIPLDLDVYVGVDAGCLTLLEQGLPLALAVGDFDSVSEEDFQSIKKNSQEMKTSVAEKNDTDLELAVKAVAERWPQAEVMIYGAFWGRMDHHLASVFLPSDPEIAPHMSMLHLLDRQNHLCYRPSGRHVIEAMEGFNYIGFMPAEGARIRIEGAKYPLSEDNYFKKAIYGSNEFIDQPIVVTVDRGYLIIIYSKDRN
ncbi:thiamine diphosphokinase [Streptococcus rubneri]|uniref:thiamine diphosphokinase n=1 Tax=Streptococcus rubneri TaxID=1234680 RepID=UPI0039C1E6E1